MNTRFRIVSTILFIALLLVSYQAAIAEATGIVTAGEYFVDTDPGEGNGTGLTALDGSFNSEHEKVQISLDTSTLTPGVHTLFIRFKNDSNTWSVARSRMFNVDGDKNVSAQEYYIDTDPGEGSRTALSADDGNFNQMVEAAGASIDTPALTSGLHTLFVRAQDADGKWGTPRQYTFEIMNQPVMSVMEYFIDTDPGIGSGTAFSGTFGFNTAVVESLVSTSTLSFGTHNLYVRGKDSWTRWGDTQIVAVLVGQEITVVKSGVGTGTVTSGDANTTIDCGGTCSGVFNNGQAVVLTATPDAGSTFGGWEGCVSVTDNVCTVTLSAPMTVTATFNANTTTTIGAPYVTYGTNGAVTLSVSAASNAPAGTVSLSVDGGTATSQVLSAVTSTISQATFTITKPNAGDHTLSASYSAQGGFSASSGTGSLTVNAYILHVSATADNKTYDGNTNATVTFSDDRVTGDDITISGVAAFVDKNAGAGKTVNISGIAVNGVIGGNYVLAWDSATATADISPKALTISGMTADNKVYDGTTSAALAGGTLVGVISGEVVSFSGQSGAFADKNAGPGKPVTVTGVSLSGVEAPNYTVSNPTGLAADISARSLAVTATGVNKVYDGTAAATVIYDDDRVEGDVLSASGTAAFADKNVGTGKAVSVTGISISGADAGNYTLSATTAGATADITARNLTVTAAGIAKVYDGTTLATVTFADDRVAGDVLTAAGIAAFSDKNVGSAKNINVTDVSISGIDAANYSLASTTASATADITAASLTVSAAGVNKVYDGTTAGSVNLSDDRVSGDELTASYANALFDNKSVGTIKTVSVSGITISGTDAGNYVLAAATAITTADISARTLTVTATGVDKVYDGTATAAVIFGDDRVTGDVLTASGTSGFDTKNVGTGKTVSVSVITISGTDAGNYALVATTADTTASITARSLTVAATASNKVYDGTTAATASLSDDRVTGDVLAASYTTAIFADKNVGAGKTVSVSGITISGIEAGNYTLAETSTSTTADITSRALTVTATGESRVYDGTIEAAVTFDDDRITGDVLTATGTSTFDTKNVGTGKIVSVIGISISGTDAGNYVLAATTASTTADIMPKTLAVTAAGIDKEYDGTTSATVTFGDDRVTGDVLTASGTSTFDTKNIGTGKTVSVSGILINGTDASNYMLATTTADTTANITTRSLIVTATAANKVYDGTTAATAILTDNRVTGDVLTTSYKGALFASKSAGTGKTITVSGISISDVDAGNYTLATTTASTVADITARPLTVAAVASNKVYDGATAATVGFSDDRVAGDEFTASYASANFADKGVGIVKTVSVDGIAISGADAANYALTGTTANAAADITPRTLTVTATGANKVYDGTTGASVSLSDDRVAGDSLTATGIAAFDDKSAGAGKTVNVADIAISGPDAGNYTLAGTTASATADITPRGLVLTGVDKVYDGTTAVSFSDDRVSGDVLTVVGTALFADKNIGTDKAITVTGINLAGPDAGNYALAGDTASLTADITARPLMITATAENKVYDGTTGAEVALAGNQVGGDDVELAFAGAAFGNRNVGSGRTVTVTGMAISGADAGNYTLATDMATASADITPRTLTVTATASDKMYDRTTGADVTLSDDRITGDALNTSYITAAFADKTVGRDKTVGIIGISISGADAGNYTLASTAASAGASITAPDGDLDGGGVSVTDALRALHIAAGLITPTAVDVSHADVAPLINGSPLPDDKINIGDVVVILRKSVQLVDWEAPGAEFARRVAE